VSIHSGIPFLAGGGYRYALDVVKLESAPEPTTIAYAYGNGAAVLLAYKQSSADAALAVIEEGKVGGKNISERVKGKLGNMVTNLRHSLAWSVLPLRMSDPKLCKRPGGRRGH
jgi:hypothetical protein